MQRVNELLRHGADAKARVVAANQLARLLEDAEEAFENAVGDAPSRPAQRPHHPVGKLLLVIRQQSEQFMSAMQASRLSTPDNSQTG